MRYYAVVALDCRQEHTAEGLQQFFQGFLKKEIPSALPEVVGAVASGYDGKKLDPSNAFGDISLVNC